MVHDMFDSKQPETFDFKDLFQGHRPEIDRRQLLRDLLGSWVVPTLLLGNVESQVSGQVRRRAGGKPTGQEGLPAASTSKVM